MYEELIAHLRECAKIDKSENTYAEAADAIEELQATVAGYEMTTDVEFVEEDGHERIRFVPKWIPVTERLPEDHKRVLVVNDDGKIMVAQRAEDDWWHYYCAYDVDRWWTGENGEVFAWMPLPEPPKEETE